MTVRFWISSILDRGLLRTPSSRESLWLPTYLLYSSTHFLNRESPFISYLVSILSTCPALLKLSSNTTQHDTTRHDIPRYSTKFDLTDRSVVLLVHQTSQAFSVSLSIPKLVAQLVLPRIFACRSIQRQKYATTGVPHPTIVVCAFKAH